MKTSIKTQITTVFIVIMTLMMVLCLGLNNFWLKDFYYQKKIEKFVKYYDKMETLVKEESDGTNAENTDNGESDAMNNALAQMRDSDNIAFIRASSSWSVDKVSQNCVSKVQADELLDRLIFYTLIGSSRDVNLKNLSLIKSTDHYVIHRCIHQAEGTEYMECYGRFDDGSFFIMSTPLESVQDSVSISNQFLLFTCLGVMILAVIVISVITRQLTQPLLQLAELSDKMAHLDFRSNYEGNQTNEIGVLGNSMNLMSKQLKTTIGELQEANEQLKKDIDEKIQIDEVRKEFLSNVSHELKTPIALIQGYAEGLQEGISEDPESREFYCGVIVDEAEKMNKMVRKLLTLNHLEFGQDALTSEVFDIAEMLDGVIRLNEIELQKKQIEVVKEYSGPRMVVGDEFKIEEVCTNYISNAINHCEGDKRITVRIESNGDYVRVTVENTGEPIPEDSLDKVWIKFYKVDKARTREYGGSGIGLSIVKAIMDAHKMPYGVYNVIYGVAFWFCLKKAEETEEK